MPPVDAALLVPFNPLRSVAKYLKIFRVSLTERLHYRGDFFLGTVLRYLPMLTTILLWEAIFAGSGHPDDIGGYTRNQMIAYLLLIHISRTFSSMPGVAAGIARHIRDADDPQAAEIAVTVIDDRQGRGPGTELVAKLCR